MHSTSPPPCNGKCQFPCALFFSSFIFPQTSITLLAALLRSRKDCRKKKGKGEKMRLTSGRGGVVYFPLISRIYAETRPMGFVHGTHFIGSVSLALYRVFWGQRLYKVGFFISGSNTRIWFVSLSLPYPYHYPYHVSLALSPRIKRAEPPQTRLQAIPSQFLARNFACFRGPTL